MEQVKNTAVAEATLIRQWQNGDPNAMHTFIVEYQDRIYNLILKICGNADDAAELAQETFVRAMDNINKFKGRSRFYTWLFRVATNLTINHCKRVVKHGAGSLDTECYKHNNPANSTLKEFFRDDNSPDPAMVAENKELCRIAVKLLMKLDAGQRAAVLLRDVEGMNYAQIANVLNIKHGTVKSRISRARSHLSENFRMLYSDTTN